VIRCSPAKSDDVFPRFTSPATRNSVRCFAIGRMTVAQSVSSQRSVIRAHETVRTANTPAHCRPRSNQSLVCSVLRYTKMAWGLWSLWAKGSAAGNAKRFPRQAPRFAAGELSINPQFRFWFRCGNLAVPRPDREDSNRRTHPVKDARHARPAGCAWLRAAYGGLRSFDRAGPPVQIWRCRDGGRLSVKFATPAARRTRGGGEAAPKSGMPSAGNSKRCWYFSCRPGGRDTGRTAIPGGRTPAPWACRARQVLGTPTRAKRGARSRLAYEILGTTGIETIADG
jgi:hypothetical protein